MTRFAADTEADRVALVADTVAAHRERGSQFCTLEADDERVGQFVEAVFRAVYDLPATYRLWAVEV